MMGYKMRETVKASIQFTWYEQTATDVRRHHDTLTDNTGRMLSDEWYSPYLLRVDESPDAPDGGRELDDRTTPRPRPPAASRPR